jgi:hypothetical protein
MDLAHSNDEPGVLPPMNHINVRFVSISPFELKIQKTDPMKTSAPAQNGTMAASLFQIAPYIDGFAPAAGLKKIEPPPSQTPFVDLVLHPDKLEAALKAARAENEAFAASCATSHTDAKRATQNRLLSSSKTKKNKAIQAHEIRKIEFIFEAPSAISVKLAADFTDWEKCPLDMIRSEDGVWFSTIPLEPGQYSYRFIVDGQWCDDPHSARRVPNPFGTENSLLVVT